MKSIRTQRIIACGLKYPGLMIPVLPVVRGKINVPTASQMVEFRRPNLPGNRTGFRRGPNNMLGTQYGEAVGNLNADTAIAFGKTGQITAAVLDNPGISLFTNWIHERFAANVAGAGNLAAIGKCIPNPQQAHQREEDVF